MFLPINKQELAERGIDKLDFVFVSGDAYVDHPSFGHALLSRLVESLGFSVGMLAQPVLDTDYLCLGEPRLGFFVTSGVVDSMVNNYTVAKKRRREDDYSEGGVAGRRPDRALTVYCRALKRLFPDKPVVIGGIEASLRRLSHYDYWSDCVMPSILADTNADLLVYGMGEKPMADILKLAARGIPLSKIKDVRGTAHLADINHASKDVVSAIASNGSDKFLVLSSHASVKSDKAAYGRAFVTASANTDPVTGKGIIQKQSDTTYAVQNPPQEALTQAETDAVYALAYERRPHPIYKLGVPAIEEVEFSVTSHRGCFGDCAFCALTYHQGRVIQNRSKESIVAEAALLTKLPGFKGYIHDVGGPSANFRERSCTEQTERGMCAHKNCVGFTVCKNLVVDHSEYLDILQTLRRLPGIKKVFIRSGVRFDYLMQDPDPQFFNELVKYHVSGQLKVAPEHICDDVLKVMNKPPKKVYDAFCKRFEDVTKRQKLDQYIVPYFISSHPGCTLKHAVELAVYLKSIDYMPKQVQDFYPTPSTLATTMYYTETDPYTGRPIYVAKSDTDKAMQRALLQYRLAANRRLVTLALEKTDRADLIGFGPACLVRPLQGPTGALKQGASKLPPRIGLAKLSGRAPSPNKKPDPFLPQKGGGAGKYKPKNKG